METPEETPPPGLELVPQNVIRVETALSRFPIHHLGRKSSVKISISEKSESGESTTKWEVKHQPGPLAYKLDTLIVNRRIEEQSRPVPKVIKLGSLRMICRELGLTEGKATQNVKNAILQNAQAFITAKTRYRTKDGEERTLEAGFSRYSVIFFGEELPGGRKADAVYIVLNDIYMRVLNGAMTRPLDYDYLKELSPASQRFYEIISYRIYAALKNGRERARMLYSEFCRYAPQPRYSEYDQVKKQMFKIHAPHKKSGYIRAVEFEQRIDEQGEPDWLMLYTPGPKARAEHRAFTKRGGPLLLEVEQPPESNELELLLTERGVAPAIAAEIVSTEPEAKVREQVEHFDFLRETEPKLIKKPGRFLSASIRGEYDTPDGFESKAEREAKEEAKRKKLREEADQKRREKAEVARQKAEEDAVKAYWLSLSPEKQTELEQRALGDASPEQLKAHDSLKRLTDGGRSYLVLLAREYVRVNRLHEPQPLEPEADPD